MSEEILLERVVFYNSYDYENRNFIVPVVGFVSFAILAARMTQFVRAENKKQNEATSKKTVKKVDNQKIYDTDKFSDSDEQEAFSMKEKSCEINKKTKKGTFRLMGEYLTSLKRKPLDALNVLVFLGSLGMSYGVCNRRYLAYKLSKLQKSNHLNVA